MAQPQPANPRVVTGKTATAAGVIALIAAFVGSWEGLRTKAYLDPVGIPTICSGYTLDVRLGQVKTVEECKLLLTDEVRAAVNGVHSCVVVPLTDGELAAYASFVYNAGRVAFCKSTIVRLLNAGDRRGACAQLSRWVYARGQQLPGLVRRRAEERRMCESGQISAGRSA